MEHEKQLYTITVDGRLFPLQSEGGGEQYPMLFYFEELAQDQLNNLGPGDFQITRVDNLEIWLGSLDERGYTRFYEVVANGIAHLENIRDRLTTERALRIGKGRGG